jgi:hypothetical protein
MAALQHGAHSAQMQEQAEPWRQEQIAAIRADLGDDVSTLKAHTIEQAATALVILRHLTQNISGSGVLTAKGKRRAAVTVYMHTLDRYVRLVQLLGLERSAKPTLTLDEHLRKNYGPRNAGVTELGASAHPDLATPSPEPVDVRRAPSVLETKKA